MVSLTPRAAAQVLEQAAASGASSTCLRVAARPAPEGGIDFGLGVDEPRTGDHEIDCEGVTLLVAPASAELLAGVVVDWIEVGPGEHRFAFARPAEP